MNAEEWEKAKQTDRHTYLENQAAGIDERRRGPATNGLCGKCTHAAIYQRRGYIEPTIWCRELHREMPDDIDSCTLFEEPNRLSLYTMAQMAVPVDGRPEPGGYL